MKTNFRYLLITASLLALTSCATRFNGIEPVAPKAYKPDNLIDVGLVYQYDRRVPLVDSLHPTLVWKSAGDNQTTYDLVIYTGILTGTIDEAAVGQGKTFTLTQGLTKAEKQRSGIFERGKQVYYHEGIEGTSHRVEEPLLPDSVYVWSVRTRTGTNVSEWSTYNYQRGWALKLQNMWWPFRTPKE
jgi:hypothetical protein